MERRRFHGISRKCVYWTKADRFHGKRYGGVKPWITTVSANHQEFGAWNHPTGVSLYILLHSSTSAQICRQSRLSKSPWWSGFDWCRVGRSQRHQFSFCINFRRVTSERAMAAHIWLEQAVNLSRGVLERCGQRITLKRHNFPLCCYIRTSEERLSSNYFFSVMCGLKFIRRCLSLSDTIRYDTIGICRCAQRLTRWPA